MSVLDGHSSLAFDRRVIRAIVGVAALLWTLPEGMVDR